MFLAFLKSCLKTNENILVVFQGVEWKMYWYSNKWFFWTFRTLNVQSTQSSVLLWCCLQAVRLALLWLPSLSPARSLWHNMMTVLLTEVAITAYSMFHPLTLSRPFPPSEQAPFNIGGRRWVFLPVEQAQFQVLWGKLHSRQVKQFYCLYFQNLFLNCNNIPMKRIRKDNLCRIKWSFYPLYQKYR